MAFDPTAATRQVESAGPAFDVLSRLADDLSEAARAARHGGQPELAAAIDGRVEVVRWARSREAERR